MGPTPLLKLPDHGVDPPLDILTEDTKIVHERRLAPKQLAARTYVATMTFHVDVGQHHYPLNQWDVLYVPDVVVFRVAECQMSLEP